MNLISFKKEDIQIIDQSTLPLFEERFAGLGPLIGPHFYTRPPNTIPKIPDESLFPHIARVKAKGKPDPFSHGVARYAPWKAEADETKVKAILTGKDLWNTVPLSLLEGQNFTMTLNAELKENGLHLNLSIVSDTDSLVGIHYYYALPNGQGKVTCAVQDQYRDPKRELKPIPEDWNYDKQHLLTIDLSTQETDFTFRPYPNPLESTIQLETPTYTLRTHYRCDCEENCWQLYHPAGASFACIEPISSQDPLHPNLSVSSLNIHLEII